MLEKLVPDPFLENYDWAYLRISSLKFYTVCFYCIPNWGLSKYIEIKMQTTCFYLILGFFKKQKAVWNCSPWLIFCITFKEKYFSCYILLTDHVLLSGCFYFLRYWAICVLQLFVDQFMTSWILKLTLSFWSSRFFFMTKKSWQKLKYLENEKSF